MSGLPIYNRLEGFVAERVLGELGNGVCTCSCRSALPAFGAQLECCLAAVAAVASLSFHSGHFLIVPCYLTRCTQLAMHIGKV